MSSAVMTRVRATKTPPYGGVRRRSRSATRVVLPVRAGLTGPASRSGVDHSSPRDRTRTVVERFDPTGEPWLARVERAGEPGFPARVPTPTPLIPDRREGGRRCRPGSSSAHPAGGSRGDGAGGDGLRCPSGEHGRLVDAGVEGSRHPAGPTVQPVEPVPESGTIGVRLEVEVVVDRRRPSHRLPWSGPTPCRARGSARRRPAGRPRRAGPDRCRPRVGPRRCRRSRPGPDRWRRPRCGCCRTSDS